MLSYFTVSGLMSSRLWVGGGGQDPFGDGLGVLALGRRRLAALSVPYPRCAGCRICRARGDGAVAASCIAIEGSSALGSGVTRRASLARNAPSTPPKTIAYRSTAARLLRVPG